MDPCLEKKLDLDQFQKKSWIWIHLRKKMDLDSFQDPGSLSGTDLDPDS